MVSRFSFRLQSVLDLRRQQYRELERQVMRLVAERRRHDEAILRLESMIEETSYSSRPDVPISPTSVMAASKFVARLGEEVAAAQSARTALLQSLQEKRQQLTTSRQQIDCLESLRERKRASHKKTLDRNEQLSIEENVIRRWSRQD